MTLGVLKTLTRKKTKQFAIVGSLPSFWFVAFLNLQSVIIATTYVKSSYPQSRFGHCRHCSFQLTVIRDLGSRDFGVVFNRRTSVLVEMFRPYTELICVAFCCSLTCCLHLLEELWNNDSTVSVAALTFLLPSRWTEKDPGHDWCSSGSGTPSRSCYATIKHVNNVATSGLSCLESSLCRCAHDYV